MRIERTDHRKPLRGRRVLRAFALLAFVGAAVISEPVQADTQSDQKAAAVMFDTLATSCISGRGTVDDFKNSLTTAATGPLALGPTETAFFRKIAAIQHYTSPGPMDADVLASIPNGGLDHVAQVIEENVLAEQAAQTPLDTVLAFGETPLVGFYAKGLDMQGRNTRTCVIFGTIGSQITQLSLFHALSLDMMTGETRDMKIDTINGEFTAFRASSKYEQGLRGINKTAKVKADLLILNTAAIKAQTGYDPEMDTVLYLQVEWSEKN